jgi:hypothetical protein
VKSLQSWERRWTTSRSQKSGKLEKNIHFFITSSLLMHPIFWALFFSGSSVFLLISEWVFVTRLGGPEFFFSLKPYFFFDKFPRGSCRACFSTNTKSKNTTTWNTYTLYGGIISFPWLLIKWFLSTL